MSSPSGDSFLHGPYYCWPADVDHAPTRLFYRKEVFLTRREASVPLLSVAGRCSVLSLKEFSTCRVTEISPEDVYVCECKYLDVEKMLKKFNKPFKVVSRRLFFPMRFLLDVFVKLLVQFFSTVPSSMRFKLIHYKVCC